MDMSLFFFGLYKLGRVRPILLITSAYHIPRATALYRKQGFEVTPYGCGFHARHRLTDEWSDLSVFDLLPNSKDIPSDDRRSGRGRRHRPLLARGNIMIRVGQ